MLKTRNCQLPKPDSQGRYRPVVGRNLNGKPQRFQVGRVKDTTAAEAQRRLDYIRLLYERQCQEYGVDYWAASYLPWASQFANGPIRVYGSDCSKNNRGQAAEELTMVYRLQAWGLPVQIVDYDLQSSGNAFIREQIEVQVNRAISDALEKLGKKWNNPEMIEKIKSEVVPEDIMEAENRTLHEALDDFVLSMKSNGISSRIHKRIDRIGYLKEHAEELPLWRLDLPAITKIVMYWRNRPNTKRGNRCSKEHAADMLKELFAFMSWLDTEPKYKWEKPKGLEQIQRTPVNVPEDNNKKTAFQTITKETYTPEQLATIVKHTDDFGRALIGVCVNCGFGASEVGQLPTSGYSLFKAHPHAAKLGMTSTDGDSWVVGDRPKSGVYGEHLLWQPVAKVVSKFIDGRPVLPMTKKGTPWYRSHSKNNQTAFANWWYNLLDKVAKTNPDVPRLPFGSLRDLLPNLVRQQFGNEVADICLQHGDPKEHDLLKCYTNVPFGKLFDATRKLEPLFTPFLEAINATTD
jgi:hypothetical protein